MRVGNFNGDGRPDVIATSIATNLVQVLLGDGNPDLVANDLGNTLGVRARKADGTFLSASTFPTGQGSRGVTVADTYGDGKVDVVCANHLDGTPSSCHGGGILVQAGHRRSRPRPRRGWARRLSATGWRPENTSGAGTSRTRPAGAWSRGSTSR